MSARPILDTPPPSPISIAISTVPSQPAFNVSVGPGSFTKQFPVPTPPVPGPTPFTVSAAYGGIRKSVTVVLSPSMIASFVCQSSGDSKLHTTCMHVVGWDSLSIYAYLTDIAPASGETIPVSSDSPVLGVGNQITVYPNTWGGTVQITEQAVSTPTTVTVTAIDPLTTVNKTVRIYLYPPMLDSLVFPNNKNTFTVSQVPLGGTPLQLTLAQRGVAPAGGSTYNASYAVTDQAGRLDLTPQQLAAPAQVMIPAGLKSMTFTVTIPPCGSGTCQYTILVVSPATSMGGVIATVNVGS